MKSKHDEATRAVFVGVAAQDSIAAVDRIPGPDDRVLTDDVVEAGGGPAATAAVAAARLGIASAFVGVVGDDEDGDRIRAGLTDADVDVSGVIVRRGVRSAHTFVLVQRSESGRMLVARPGPALHIDEGSRAAALLATAGWVHVDHAGWPAVAGWRSRAPFRLSVDGGNPIEEFSPSGVDLYVPTIAALRRHYGDRPDTALLAAALADGARCVVATRGDGGALGTDTEGVHVHVDALPVDVCSTVGAGDVFHGALVAAAVRGFPLDARVAYANAAAGLSCRGLDGRSAIPSHEQTLAALRHSAESSVR